MNLGATAGGGSCAPAAQHADAAHAHWRSSSGHWAPGRLDLACFGCQWGALALTDCLCSGSMGCTASRAWAVAREERSQQKGQAGCMRANRAPAAPRKHARTHARMHACMAARRGARADGHPHGEEPAGVGAEGGGRCVCVRAGRVQARFISSMGARVCVRLQQLMH